MAFRLPILNLACSIWTGGPAPPYPPPGLPRLTGVQCQLALDHMVPSLVALRLRLPSLIRFLARIDVRSFVVSGVADIIECPTGSGNWFTVAEVLDVARGFTNEYRQALVLPVQTNVPMS